MTTKTDITTTSTPTDATSSERPVPFFARKLGRPALSVRSGIRAGLQESKVKVL